MTALAAEAAEEAPRALIIAAPRLPTVSRNVVLSQFSSLITSVTFLPLIFAFV